MFENHSKSLILLKSLKSVRAEKRALRKRALGKGLACSVHPNLGNRDFIHISIEHQLNVSNLNPNLGNLGNLQFMLQ